MFMLEIPSSLNYMRWTDDINNIGKARFKAALVRRWWTIEGVEFIDRNCLTADRFLYDDIQRKVYITFDTEDEALMFKLEKL